MAAVTRIKKMIVQIGVPLAGKTTDAKTGVKKMAERGERAVVLSLDDMPGVYEERPLIVDSDSAAPNSMIGQIIDVVRETNVYLFEHASQGDTFSDDDLQRIALQFAVTNFPLPQLSEIVRSAYHEAFSSFFVKEACIDLSSDEIKMPPEPQTMLVFQFDKMSSAIKAFQSKVKEAIADEEIDTIIISNCNTKLDAFRSYVYCACKNKVKVEFRNYAIPTYPVLFERNFTRFWRTGKWIPLEIIKRNIIQQNALYALFPNGIDVQRVILDRDESSNNIRRGSGYRSGDRRGRGRGRSGGNRGRR